VSEATNLFSGMRQELQIWSKRISDNSQRVLGVKTTIQTGQKGISVLTKRINEVNKTMAAITTLLKHIPTKGELSLHEQILEEQMALVGEVNTGLTTTMEGYKFPESLPYDFGRTLVAAGPSRTQYVLLAREANLQQSPSVSSLRDTASESS
jgi:hypothetical protein